MRVAGWGLLLSACLPSFPDVESACVEDPPDAGLGPIGTDALRRINCHRRYLGLWEVDVSPRVQQAAQAHFDYLAQHAELAVDDVVVLPKRRNLLLEDPADEGFTGGDDYARMVASGAVPDDSGAALAGSWGWPVIDTSVGGDAWVAQPYARDLWLQPGIVGVGIAEGMVDGVRIAYANVFATLPSGIQTLRPIVYPRDGQEGVPPVYVDPDAPTGDPLATGPRGFPITLTVSTWELSTDDFNPFGVQVDAPVLRPVGGAAVAVDVLVPGPASIMPMRTTVVVLPKAPLAGNTTYELEVSLGTRVIDYEVVSTFTTGPMPE